jgi:hypothetical protein
MLDHARYRDLRPIVVTNAISDTCSDKDLEQRRSISVALKISSEALDRLSEPSGFSRQRKARSRSGPFVKR